MESSFLASYMRLSKGFAVPTDAEHESPESIRTVTDRCGSSFRCRRIWCSHDYWRLPFRHTDTVVGKGMLLTPSRILHFKFKCLSRRCFRAGLPDMFHDRNLPQELLLRDYARVSTDAPSANAMGTSIPIAVTRQSRRLSSLPAFFRFPMFIWFHLLLLKFFRLIRRALSVGRRPPLPQHRRAPAMLSRRQCTDPDPRRSENIGRTPVCRRQDNS